MEKLGYLKSKLATNVPETVTIVKRIGTYPELDYTTKQPTGRDQVLYNFRMSTGEEVRHYAKEREEDTLKMFNAGDRVVVTRKETEAKDGKRIYFLDWTAEGDITASAKPQLKSNTYEVRTAPKQQNDYELAKEAHDWKLGLAGLLQAHVIAGKGKEDARKAAVEDATWVRAAAVKLAESKREKEEIAQVPVVEYTPSVDVNDLPF